MRPDRSQTLPRGGAESLEIQRLRDALGEARERTLTLVEPVSEENLDRVHDPLMSPLVWDLGHIAAFEDLWLCQRAGGLEPLEPELAHVYDAAETPRADRGDLPYLRRGDALAFMAAVRERALDVLERVDLSSDGDRLNANGFVWDMLVQHEHQHNETMLQTLQLAEPGVYSPSRPPRAEAPADGGPDDGAGARRRVSHGRPRPGIRLRQRAAPAHRRPAGVRDRPHARDQRRLRRVRGRRRLRAAGAVDPRGLGLARGGAGRAAAVLDR